MDSNLHFVTDNHVIWLASAQQYKESICYEYDITLPMPGLRNTVLATILKEFQEFGKAIVHASDTYYKNTASLHMTVLDTRGINACLKQIISDYPQVQKLQVQLIDDDKHELKDRDPVDDTEIPSLYDVYMGCVDMGRQPRIMISCDGLYLSETVN